MNKKEIYSQILDLRNRLANDIEPEIYEEDHIVLDAVLDLLEKQERRK